MTVPLTVLMAVRNGAPYVRAAVQSVLDQTYGDFRFLIVDDASTDDTCEIVLSYDDQRVELLCLERNVGQTAALNIGLRRISTPWIARMDGDDYSAPSRLEEQMRVLADNPSVGCVGTGIWEFRDDPWIVETIRLRPQDHAGIKHAALYGTGMIHGSIVISRDALLDIGGYDERYRYGADRDMFIRLLAKYRAMNIPKPLLGIRRHANQDSFSIGAADEYIDIFARLLSEDGYMPEEVAIVRGSLAYSYLFRASCFRAQGQYGEWWKDVVRAFRLSPWTCVRRTFGMVSTHVLPRAVRTSLERFPEVRNVKSQRTVSRGPGARPGIDWRRRRQNGDEDSGPGMLASIERLAEVLSEVRRRCPDLPVVAIPWIHAKHPVHPVQRELIEAGSIFQAGVSGTNHVWGVGRWRGAGVWVGRFGLCLLYATYLTVRLVRLRLSLRREMARLKHQRFDLVAKTWRFGAGQTADDHDFYYGDLQKRLEERGVRMLLLYGHPEGKGWRVFPSPNVSTALSPQLPELCLVPLFAPFRMVFQQVCTSVRLFRIAAMVSDPLIRRVTIRASHDSLSRHILPIGFYYWIGKTAVEIWRPRAFVTLYEGHGWEQCIWWGAKTADSTCQTVGFQHTVLLRHQLALLRSKDDSPYSRPDVALCSGPRTLEMLRRSHTRSTLIPFGTFRHSTELHSIQAPCPQRRTVLVVPEHFLEEEKLLFNSAMQAALLLPHYRFILRCHPVVPFEKIRRYLERDPEALPNVEVSLERPIREDFARSSVILYRGSSSVLYALLHGLKPVYLHDDGHHEVDPLFELSSGWRVRAFSIQELEEVLRLYAETDPSYAAEARREAVDYLGTYVIPVDSSSVDRFLSVVGLTNTVTAG